GLVAALILPMSFMWLDKATSAEIDMLQVFWVTAALLCFFRALDEEDKETRRGGDKETRRGGDKEKENRPSLVSLSPCLPLSLSPPLLVSPSPCLSAWLWWIGALLCVAGGVLTKWTAPAFFYGTGIPLLWWRGQLRLLFGRRHLVSAALGAGV